LFLDEESSGDNGDEVILIGTTNISPVVDSNALVAQITESGVKQISDNMKSNQQNYEGSLVSDEDNIDSVTTPLDSATHDYECMDPRVYSAKFSAFKKLVDNLDLLNALKKVNCKN
jgi:hypothetical protein